MLIPDHETEVDFLNCEAISRTVVQLLNANRGRALTMGIHGDWGAGKSSILKMIECELSATQEVACPWFNGWAFQGFEDAKSVLIEVIITELIRKRSTKGKVKELGKRLLRRVDWLKVAKRGSGIAFNLMTGLPSPDQIETVIGGLKATISASAKTLTSEQIETSFADATSLLKPAEEESLPEVIHDFREQFSALLKEAKIEQLVVLIDDLDRCLPATAIETLEAIRLFLFVPGTAFVIGADEAMIEYAVRQHFPDLPVSTGPLPYSRNYLEKLIQVPFRIPAIGTQETRFYVLLLMVEAIVGSAHEGFRKLVAKAKEGLNKPWLGVSLPQSDVQSVDPQKREKLDAAFVLATQIGPILAEGTKGNPRQIKRFLNALMVRQAIARARGFEELVAQSTLAKLMLAERFQPDFYDYVAAQAMRSEDGSVTDFSTLENETRQETHVQTGKRQKAAVKREVSEESEKWLEREWLVRWLKIEPSLSDVDLRPYVFVARDKRVLASAGETGGLDALVERLAGSGLGLRQVEPEARALTAGDAQTVFNALRERVLAANSFASPPSGFEGLGILAKHHSRFQTELMALVGSLDAKSLGIWIIRGWNEVLTEAIAKAQFQTLLDGWTQQDDNALLKRAAQQAIGSVKGGAH
jgi:hypothetical protein